ncbi:hypothetical protein F0562_011593 [Nyssa sinensis]|uniref:Uncharacterized protein n=1 Tax=Nyssa sinensis TaxID=561372 RepID=A0A5J4ZR46_9ASTE|nr:hypothetical protein F0562_011593 [Nyssa sinensis]
MAVSFGVIATFALIFAIFLPAVQAQSLAPAPAPTSDGTTIDQGIAVCADVTGTGAHLYHPHSGCSIQLLS